LRNPKVPRRLIAPFSEPEHRSLLALADERERALALVLLDTGLRLSELASLTVAAVRPGRVGGAAELWRGRLFTWPIPRTSAR
jgi:integrase